MFAGTFSNYDNTRRQFETKSISRPASLLTVRTSAQAWSQLHKAFHTYKSGPGAYLRLSMAL